MEKDKVQILGAYGTKAKGFGTSSFYLNEHTVIDAGNLLDSLEEKSAVIENIYLTHSHLDHILDIAYILDNYFTLRTKTLNIIGLRATLNAVKEHFLNDILWPDFSKIKLDNSQNYVVNYVPIEFNKKYMLSQNEYISAFETDHTVQSCGYIYTKENKSLMITSDTYSLKNVIALLDQHKDIKSLIVECSFPSDMEKLAKKSKHLTPKILFEQLNYLKRDDILIYINHLKPYYVKKIMHEIEQYRVKYRIKVLKDKEFIHFC